MKFWTNFSVLQFETWPHFFSKFHDEILKNKIVIAFASYIFLINLTPFSPFQAVKLESLRAGRTRYLVVVSRPATRQAQQNLSHNQDAPSGDPPHPPLASGNSLSISSNSISLNPTSYFNEAATTSSRLGANLTAATCDNDSTSSDDNTVQCHPADESQCETESNFGSSCSRSSSNEIEESCLLGIDCNEKTTVGLVLRVLADTAIRLDGDGWVDLRWWIDDLLT